MLKIQQGVIIIGYSNTEQLKTFASFYVNVHFISFRFFFFITLESWRQTRSTEITY